MSEPAPAIPFVTADLPGSGGRRQGLAGGLPRGRGPGLPPSGAGPHLYLRVEKRGRTTRDVVQALAALLGVAERDAGWAGLKDKQARSRRSGCPFPSRPTPPPRPSPARASGCWRSRATATSSAPATSRGEPLHGGRAGGRPRAGAHLRRGPRGAGPPELLRRPALRRRGAQRRGGQGPPPRGGHPGGAQGLARPLPPPTLHLRLPVASLQPLARRAASPTASSPRALAGDVMKKLETGGSSPATDPAVDGPRVERASKISPAGPMFGHKMLRGGGRGAAREARVLAEGSSPSPTSPAAAARPRARAGPRASPFAWSSRRSRTATPRASYCRRARTPRWCWASS